MSYYAYAPPLRSSTPPLYYHRPAGVPPAYRTLAPTPATAIQTTYLGDSYAHPRASVENAHRRSTMQCTQEADSRHSVHPEYGHTMNNTMTDSTSYVHTTCSTSSNTNDDMNTRNPGIASNARSNAFTYPARHVEGSTAQHAVNSNDNVVADGSKNNYNIAASTSRSSWPRLSYPVTTHETHSCQTSLARPESMANALASLSEQNNGNSYDNRNSYTNGDVHNSNKNNYCHRSSGSVYTGYAAKPATATTAASGPASARSTTAAAASSSSAAVLSGTASMPSCPSISDSYPPYLAQSRLPCCYPTSNIDHTANATTADGVSSSAPLAAVRNDNSSAWSTHSRSSRRTDLDSFSARLAQTEEALHQLGTGEAELRIELAELRRVQQSQTGEQLQLSHGWSALLELEERYHTEIAPDRQPEIAQAELRVMALQSRAKDTQEYLRQLQQTLQHRAHVHTEHAHLLRELSALSVTATELRCRRSQAIARAELYFELESQRGELTNRKARELERELREMISARGGSSLAAAMGRNNNAANGVVPPLARLLAVRNNDKDASNAHDNDVRESGEGRSVRFAHDGANSANAASFSSMRDSNYVCQTSTDEDTAGLSSESASLPHDSLVTSALGGGVDWASTSVCLGLADDEESMEVTLHRQNKHNSSSNKNSNHTNIANKEDTAAGVDVRDMYNEDDTATENARSNEDTAASVLGRHLGGASVSFSFNQTHAAQREALSKRRRVEMVSV